MQRTVIGLPIILAAALASSLAPGGAFATGTLLNNGVLQLTFADATGTTPITADVAGGFIWTASGGSPDGARLARHNPDGTLNQTYSPNIDFRSLYTNNAGQLFAKEFGTGAVYSISNTGVPALLYNLNDPEAQSSASLNGNDSELYTMAAPTLFRYNAANGAPLGSFNLNGMSGAEQGFPDGTQMETNNAGRIITYSNGVVSEWDLTGTRVGTCTIPIASPGGFDTTWSFAVGSDDRVYLYEEPTASWKAYSVGLEGATPVEATTWGAIKSRFETSDR